MRIAIIGGGVGGLIVLQHLHQNHHCELYDSNERIGGVWSNSNLNEISLQIEPTTYRFPQNSEYPAGKSGQDIYQYLNEFVNKNNLSTSIFLQHKITNIDIKNKKCYLKIKNKSKILEPQPFDWVICTGNTTHPRIPNIILEHPDNCPPWIHSGHLTNTFVQNTNNKKIIVVGGSKSAVEAVLRFHPHNHVIWIARRFSSYHLTKSKTSIDLSKVPRCLVNTYHQGFSDCMADLRVYPGQRQHGGSFNFITEEQHITLFNEVTKIQSSIKEVTKTTIVLENGEVVPCDLLVFATGYLPTMCPTTQKNPRLILLKTVDDSNLYIYFSHFCGYSIQANRIQTFIKDNNPKLEFSEWNKNHSELAYFLYACEFYLKFTFFPKSTLTTFNSYLWKIRLFVIVVILILIIYLLYQLICVLMKKLVF